MTSQASELKSKLVREGFIFLLCALGCFILAGIFSSAFLSLAGFSAFTGAIVSNSAASRLQGLRTDK